MLVVPSEGIRQVMSVGCYKFTALNRDGGSHVMSAGFANSLHRIGVVEVIL